jgi:Ca-activated chloride channel family protein
LDDQRRNADVMLLLDHSGSMNESIGNTTKIEGAKAGLKEFVNKFGNDDQLGLTIFNDQSNVVVPISQLGPKRQQVLSSIDGVVANGNTSLFDTIAAQQEALKKMPSKNIKALIVLTDGLETASQMNLDQLLQRVRFTENDARNGVYIFTIAYGSDADAKTLSAIAEAAGGQEYNSPPDPITLVYDRISHITY